MKNIFFISDVHFGHANMCNFTNWDGTKARNFKSFEEADEAMVKNWNNLVAPQDTIYVLGDIAYACKKEYADSILTRLNGQKKLIAGNHDLWSTQWYLKHFKYVRGCCHLDNFYLSHTPIHPSCRGRFKLNIHGHIHGERVMITKFNRENDIMQVSDPFYFNVSADYNYRYAPVPYEEIQAYYQKCLDEGLLQPIPKRREKDEAIDEL
jgi:calcineurin-like phosphoesterase family protein